MPELTGKMWLSNNFNCKKKGNFKYDNRSNVKETMSKEICQNLKILRSIIRGHIKLISLLYALSVDHPGSLSIRKEKLAIPKTIKAFLFPSLLALGTSCTTILKLSNVPGLQTRDCFGIARSIINRSTFVMFWLKAPQWQKEL